MFKNLKKKFAKVALVALALQLVVMGLGTGATGAYAAEPVLPLTPLTAIGVIVGTPQVGQVLTAGALTPADATVIYKWKASDTGVDGSFTDIPGATTNTYTPIVTYVSKYVRVVATGTGSFTGIQKSLPVGPIVAQTPITAIGAIVGTPQVGQVLSAGALTPTDATVDYQWRISNTGGIGTFIDILGVTSNNYTPIASDFGKYLRVFATGTGSFAGVAKSAVVGPIVAQTPLTAIGAIVGTPQVAQVLTVGAITPADATVVYKWKISDTGVDGSFTNIPGAISNTYTLVTSDLGKYVRVVVTGTGSFTGKVKSLPVGPIVAAQTPLTDIGAIIGTPQVGQILTAGALAPVGATVTYQWQIATTIAGAYTDILGATNNTYTLVASDLGKYIQVSATGTGSYTSVVKSTPVLATAVDTTAPDSVTNLTPTFDALGHVTLTWINPTTSYSKLEVYRLDGGIVQELAKGVTTYTDNTTELGLTYSYLVAVFDEAGNYNNGTTVSVRPVTIAAAVSDSTTYVPIDTTNTDTNTDTGTDTSVKAEITNDTTNNDAKDDSGFPVWGIILLVILALVGGYLIWNQKPALEPIVTVETKKNNTRSTGSRSTTKKK